MIYTLLKNIILLLIINILADTNTYAITILGILMFKCMDNNPPMILIDSISILVFILIVARLFVLPIAYKKLEYSQNFKLISKFIQKLKKSWYLKLLVLIIVYLCSWSYGLPWFNGGFKGQLSTGLIFGLFGSYIVLYIYWFIEKYIQKLS